MQQSDQVRTHCRRQSHDLGLIQTLSLKPGVGVSIAYEDRAEIHDLISEYAYTFDEDRIDEHVTLFLDDAELSFYVADRDQPTVTTSSNEERLEVVQGIRSSELNQPGKPRHFQTNTILRKLSNSRILGRTMVVCTQQPYDGSDCRLLFSGVYEDEFQKANGRWFFAIRKGMLDLRTPPNIEPV